MDGHEGRTHRNGSPESVSGTGTVRECVEELGGGNSKLLPSEVPPGPGSTSHAFPGAAMCLSVTLYFVTLCISSHPLHLPVCTRSCLFSKFNLISFTGLYFSYFYGPSSLLFL